MYLPIPLIFWQIVSKSQFLSGMKCILIQVFLSSFCSKAKERRQAFYLSMVKGRTDEFRYFPSALAKREIETTSCRIWTWDTDTISCDDDYYSKYTSSTDKSWLTS